MPLSILPSTHISTYLILSHRIRLVLSCVLISCPLLSFLIFFLSYRPIPSCPFYKHIHLYTLPHPTVCYTICHLISSHLISSYLILSYLSMESFYPDARSLSSRTVFCLSFAGCDTSCCTLGWFQILGPVATKGPRTRDLKVILVLICSILHDLYPFRISIYHPYIAYYTLECIYIHIYI